MTRRFAYGLLKRHDDQRGRIAVELTHEVASLITVAKLTVENAAGQLQRGQAEDASSLLFTTSQHLRDTLANVRRISTELVPSSLNDLGLAATIEWLCRNLREAHPDMRVELQLDVDDSVDWPGTEGRSIPHHRRGADQRCTPCSRIAHARDLDCDAEPDPADHR